MINPFSEKQVREGVISYGLSSYGYDLRVADVYIVQNLRQRKLHRGRSEEFRRTLVCYHGPGRLHRPTQLIRIGPLGGILQDFPAMF
jgi:hypothetical protein